MTITTENTILFRGIAGDPDEITESTLQLTFLNKLSLQRIPVPEVRIQRSCPWYFPGSGQLTAAQALEQRTEAKDGGIARQYSRSYRCGYSADVAGGVGNLNNGVAFTSCDKSRGQCQQRGMFSTDSSGRVTSRFGGFDFVPSAILVRTSGDKTSHLSPLVDNAAKYNDPVPIVYGTGWLKTAVIFARNDGNLTRMEAVLGMGSIQSVLKVVVNDVEIPLGVAGQDMTTTGWYSVLTTGARSGTFDLSFTDAQGNPLGDPYGNISVLTVAVPNRISNGQSLPTVEVLLQGMQIDAYNPDGTFQTTAFSNNPAWVILDILRRCGWSTTDLNMPSFALAARFCGTAIETQDVNGTNIIAAQYQCNLILTKRQSAATVIRGIRVASSLMLRYGVTGLLELLPETTIAAQQPILPDGGNSIALVNGGWPAYEFSDASAPFSGIVRLPDGTSSLRLSSRQIAESSNRLSVEFQDAFNEYQQDSLSVVDSYDSALIGYEISSQSTALGIANLNQATRVLLRQLDKSTNGNLFVQFQTSFRALKVRPGDIIALTYLKEGLSRALFRVVKLSPSLNYELVTVLAQIHNDDWYSSNLAVLEGAGRQAGSSVQIPRPLIGLVPHQSVGGPVTYFDFQVQESIHALNDGTATDTLTTGFAVPGRPAPNSPHLPLLSLSPEYSGTGGTLTGSGSYYYAVSAVDSGGNEGALSFTVYTSIPAGTNSNTVTISELSFPSTAVSFNVYRGTTPQLLYRIAAAQPLQNTFQDTGLPPQALGPPDASFDHANFYYRFENAGPFLANKFSQTTIGWDGMGAAPLAYSGMIVRITDGTGSNQERIVTTNDQTTLTVNPPWAVAPDASSNFVVVENSWRFAAIAVSSPVQFEIPYQAGAVIEISGRGANVYNVEGSAELCPVTRWAIGGGNVDSGITIPPGFTLGIPGAGALTVSQVGFDDMTNTSSVSSGTLQMYSWNELSVPNAYTLAAAVAPDATAISLNGISAAAAENQIVQIDQELMIILSVTQSSNTYQIGRGALSSVAAAHSQNSSVLHLDAATIVLPFALDFFANRASINFIHTLSLPDVRVSGAQFWVRNAFGDSQAKSQCYTAIQPDGGLRTLSGGQFSLQIAGIIGTQQNAALPLLVQASHAVRDVRAVVGQAPAGYSIVIDVLQDSQEYCPSLTISSPHTTSQVVNGVTLPPLKEGSLLTMNVSLQPVPSYVGQTSPGRNLTVIIRL